MNELDPHETSTWPVLACLGVPSRFRLLRALAVADRCVGELAEAVGLSQSCTTRHLQALERVGLVKGHREGRRVRFRLRAEAPGLGELLGWALSGAGLEAPPAAADPIRDRMAAQKITTPVDRMARTNTPVLRAASGAQSRMADPGPDDPAGPVDHDANPQAANGLMRTRRPDDLEDYLL